MLLLSNISSVALLIAVFVFCPTSIQISLPCSIHVSSHGLLDPHLCIAGAPKYHNVSSSTILTG